MFFRCGKLDNVQQPSLRKSQHETSPHRALIPTTALIFAGYAVIGLEAAALPVFVHQRLGLSVQWAGIAVSAQFVATLLNRPFAGATVDRLRPQRAMFGGLLLCLVSSALLAVAGLLRGHPLAVYGVILISRLILGFAMSWVPVAGTVWGIARVGPSHTAQVVAWSGVASYGSLALGSPLGLMLAQRYGLLALGLVSGIVVAVAALLSMRVEAAPQTQGARLRFAAVFGRVFPFGGMLALAASGFGCFLSLITIVFTSRHWAHPGLPLTVYGICFVAMRLFASPLSKNVGPIRTATASLTLQIVGLLLLSQAGSPLPGLIAAGLIGSGFSLVFPALCVLAIQSVDPANQASAVSVFTAFIELSLAITTAVSGWMLERIGFSRTFECAAALALASLLALLFVRRDENAPSFQ
ncbi:MFS transporter [Granulicella cerasi]|uniref:MFS transporter n=1 Tax=Granulicella cerasi TaxID=741063 RepID=A0ABW1Z5L3_9BACT|nr:MFS transporter [Granulicella cerasi]